MSLFAEWSKFCSFWPGKSPKAAHWKTLINGSTNNKVWYDRMSKKKYPQPKINGHPPVLFTRRLRAGLPAGSVAGSLRLHCLRYALCALRYALGSSAFSLQSNLLFFNLLHWYPKNSFSLCAMRSALCALRLFSSLKPIALYYKFHICIICLQ